MKGEIKINNDELRKIVQEHIAKKFMPPVRVTNVSSDGYGALKMTVDFTDEPEEIEVEE